MLDALRPAPLTVPTALTEPFGLVAPLGAVNLWLGVAGALAVAVLVLSWRLLYPKPRISVSDRGILDRNLGVGWIPWESVEGAYFPRTVEFQGVLLRLRPSPRLRKLGSKLGPSRTDGPPFEVRIDLADSEWNPVDLLQEILARTGAPASHVNAG